MRQAHDSGWRSVLDAAGFTNSAGIGQAGDYVIERAFVEK